MLPPPSSARSASFSLARRIGSLALSLILVAPWAQAQTAATAPAQVLFDDVNRILQTEYGGLSTLDRVALGKEYQQRLDAVCQTIPTTCPAEKAYPVLQAEISALDDEHSYFQTPEDFDDFMTSALGGNRKQFGVKLAPLGGENRVVLEVVPQSAAEEAGLQRGDLLQTLNGQPYHYSDLRQAREAGKSIELGFDRSGKRLTVTLTPRESSSRDLPRLTLKDGVAVMRIPTFLSGGGVAQQVHDLVAQARKQGAVGMIVDLRGNGGGSLSECDSAVSAFVPDFVRIARTSDGNVQTRVSRGVRLEDGVRMGGVRSPSLWTGPLTVLVDADSASCSEFFAYEVQYSGRGLVVGENTAGVGNTATRVFELPGDVALQLTITHYVKPDGTPYPASITPDQVHLQTEDDVRRLTLGQDTLLDFGVQALSGAPSLPAERQHR